MVIGDKQWAWLSPLFVRYDISAETGQVGVSVAPR